MKISKHAVHTLVEKKETGKNRRKKDGKRTNLMFTRSSKD